MTTNRSMRPINIGLSHPLKGGMRKHRPSLSKLLVVYIVFNVTAFYLMLQRMDAIGNMTFLYGEKESDLDKSRRSLTERKARYYSYQQSEANRTGPGEQGAAVKLSKEEVALIESEMKKEGFSKYVNSLVSLDRSLLDYRDEACKNQHYPSDLPTASVIIIFRNEIQRVVLRTVHSVINRTPPQYLKEVILVDDASDREELLRPLDEHIEQQWPDGIVRIIRLPKTSGLIRTRLAGVAAATGDVVIMMDGHMEASKGWIQPILARIKENKRILVSSLVDIIQPQTLQYTKYDILYQTFSWNMVYVWTSLPPGTKYNPVEPIPTYALVGCIMAMDKATFLEMGSFDTGMTLWGGENVELPIRLWMCGGRVEILPCSRVAHTYRGGFGRPWKGSIGESLSHNGQRIAEVWLDEYKDQYYVVHQSFLKKAAEVRANVTDRIALREKLGCKDFKWLLDNVVKPPMFMYTRNVTTWGQLKHVATDKCLDSLNTLQYRENVAGVHDCHGPLSLGYTQLFTLTKTRQLRREMHCLSSGNKTPGRNVTLNPNCPDQPSHWWTYNEKTKQFVHDLSKLCLEVLPGKQPILYVQLNKCKKKPTQQWTWITYKLSDVLQPV